MPNPVEYAEKNLGVHKVYEEAEASLARHKKAQEKLQQARNDIRACKSNQDARTAEVTAEVHGANPDTSATAMKELVKAALATDIKTGELRVRMTALENQRDQAEADIRHEEMDLRVRSARMDELAGLLQFYAVAKSAANNPQESK